MGKEKVYVCEECNFKADKIKKCCGKKMVDIKHATKYSDHICGCRK